MNEILHKFMEDLFGVKMSNMGWTARYVSLPTIITEEELKKYLPQ